MMRRMEQKHMVDWIISNVKKSITPAQVTIVQWCMSVLSSVFGQSYSPKKFFQEDAALKKCIADLKKLSAA